MTELLPIAAGALLGLVAGRLSPPPRLRAILPLSILLGIAISAVTGELSISWGYVLVDVPGVALSAAVSLASSRSVPARGQRLT
jgi:hypothetical protein